MREKVIENEIKKGLKTLGRKCYFFKHAAGCTMPPGIADIICCICGRSIWIETKAPNGTQSDVQKAFQSQIEDSGGEYWLCLSYNQFVEKLNDLIRRIKNGKYNN